MPENLPKWIQARLADEPLRAKSLLATVLGDSVAPHGGRVWLGSIIALLAPFGISERLVRTSVFRLVEDGWLLGQRSGRRSVYAITPGGARRIEHAHRRIYAPARDDWDGTWTLLVVASGAHGARVRARIKRELAWEGYAALASGLYAHPSNDLESVGEILAGCGASGQWAAFTARQGPLSEGSTESELALSSWPLDELAERYRAFVERFSEFARRGDVSDGRAAFVGRTLLVHAYRRVVLHDPRLPVRLLPPDWPGHRAYALCQSAYTRLRAGSESFFAQCYDAEAGATPPLLPYFLERFRQAGAHLERASQQSA